MRDDFHPGGKRDPSWQYPNPREKALSHRVATTTRLSDGGARPVAPLMDDPRPMFEATQQEDAARLSRHPLFN
ncbi:MAG TPA: hypothetical protein VIL19_07010, partial [Casimicrobiaceae bacterium]